MKRKILSIDEYVAEEKMFESQSAEYQLLEEAENLREEYQKYFKETLEAFGVASLGELPREKRSEFFSKIKEGWEKGKGRKGNVSKGNVSEGEVTDDQYKKAVEMKKECEDKLSKLQKEMEECGEDEEAKKAELAQERKECEEKIKECDAQISGYDGPLKEGKIESDEDFKEYATNKLKKSFGDDYDENKATEVIDGLLKKKKDDDLDYGAIVGMLNK